ncbi:hypothetical protein L218DRAFT_656364 [Marasmius fiardii PR-910]|nr:hypothetical protein L218DRAFT_656364 [Marasmius fiardii PR-910]
MNVIVLSSREIPPSRFSIFHAPVNVTFQFLINSRNPVSPAHLVAPYLHYNTLLRLGEVHMQRRRILAQYLNCDIDDRLRSYCRFELPLHLAGRQAESMVTGVFSANETRSLCIGHLYRLQPMDDSLFFFAPPPSSSKPDFRIKITGSFLFERSTGTAP